MPSAERPPGPPAPTVLVLCFSPLAHDARVLRQIDALRREFTVTTCGYGPPPRPGVEHVRLPDGLTAWKLDRRLLILRRFRDVYWGQESVVAAYRLLAGRTFDVIVADDIETVPLALELAPRGGVHADLHEYAPRLKEDVPRWRAFVGPYMRWLCRAALPSAAAVTTVADGIAREYERQFGIRCGVVTNAAPRRDGAPHPPHDPIRLVHSGAAQPGRRLEVMIDAAAQVLTARPGSVVLDLYLTPNDPAYIAALRDRVADVDGIEVLDPVPHAELADALAAYDVGLFACPETTFSLAHALPNKFFDYIQARLAIVISPSVEMEELLREHDLGVVSQEMTPASFARAIRSLTPRSIEHFSRSADAAAGVLCAEREMPRFVESVRRIAEGLPDAAGATA